MENKFTDKNNKLEKRKSELNKYLIRIHVFLFRCLPHLLDQLKIHNKEKAESSLDVGAVATFFLL